MKRGCLATILKSYVHLIATEDDEVIPEAEPMENSPYKIKGHDIKNCFSLPCAIDHVQSCCNSPSLYSLCRDRGSVNLSYQDSWSDEG